MGFVAHANPVFFAQTAQLATATTSVTYMSAGNATTTLQYDSYTAGNPTAAQNATLFVQFAGSSTASTLKINLEYSQDGIDWYQDGGTFSSSEYASSTKSFDVSTVNQYTFQFASSTVGLVTTPTATSSRAINVPTPTRFLRAIFSIPVGSSAGAVWPQIIPAKQYAS